MTHVDRADPEDDEIVRLAEENARLKQLAELRAFSIKSQTCKHKSEQESLEAECFICGTLDCPSGCELHYHHDGCAECDQWPSSGAGSPQ